MACSYKGNDICRVYDDERLTRPLKKFIADNVWRLQLGVASYSVSLILCGLLEKIGINIQEEIDLVDIGAHNIVSLEELCRKGVDGAIKSGDFSRIALTHATSLCVNLDVAWRKKEEVKQLQESINCQNDVLKRTQLLLSAHLWMFEEIRISQPGAHLIPADNRITITHTLSSAVKTLAAWRTTIFKMREEIASFVVAINQRLKWAVGANPSLQNLLIAFTIAVTNKNSQFDDCDRVAEIALKHCKALLYYESLRLRTKEALEQDQIFLNLLSQWEKSCVMSQSCSTVVTRVEESLVELLDPEGPIDHTWLCNVAGLIDEMTDQVHNEIGRIEKCMVNAQDILYNCAHKLRTLMGVHLRMAADVRSLLRSTLKVEGNHVQSIKDYLKKYKEFLDTISELHGHVLSKDFTEEVVDGTLNQISTVLGAINDIFDYLYLFENDFNMSADVATTTAAIEDKQQTDSVLLSSPEAKNPKGMSAP